MSAPTTTATPEQLVENLLRDLQAKANRLWLSDAEREPLLDHLNYSYKDHWTELQSVLDDERKQLRCWLLRSELQTSVRNKLISEWIAQNVKTTEDEREALKYEIYSYVKEDRIEDLRRYLCDVLLLGLTKAQKRRRRKKYGDGGYFGHSWEALKGIVRVVIVVAIFAAAQSKFETIVFAMLVMIYSTTYGSAAEESLGLQFLLVELRKEFKRLRRFLKEEVRDDDRWYEYLSEQELVKDHNREGVRFWIRTAFFWVLWLIAIRKLVASLIV